MTEEEFVDQENAELPGPDTFLSVEGGLQDLVIHKQTTSDGPLIYWGIRPRQDPALFEREEPTYRYQLPRGTSVIGGRVKPPSSTAEDRLRKWCIEHEIGDIDITQ